MNLKVIEKFELKGKNLGVVSTKVSGFHHAVLVEFESDKSDANYKTIAGKTCTCGSPHGLVTELKQYYLANDL